MSDHVFRPETLAIHAGQIPDAATGARALPIYQTTSFVFDSAEHAASRFNLQTFGNVYSRLSNPTVAALEERVAALEGGRAAVASASGMAAEAMALMTLLQAGDHVVAAGALYGGTVWMLAVSPMSVWQILQGVETLPLRMERHCRNALAVAGFLRGHAGVAWVNYPGLPDHPQHALLQRQMRGASGLLAFGVKGGIAPGVKFIESARFMSHLVNIGDTRTLISHPASATHCQLDADQRRAAGVLPDMVRIRSGWSTSTTSCGTSTRPWLLPRPDPAALRPARLSVRNFRRERFELALRSTAVHPYGEHRRREIGSRSRKVLMLSPVSTARR